jgi:hypothetical protein
MFGAGLAALLLLSIAALWLFWRGPARDALPEALTIGGSDRFTPQPNPGRIENPDGPIEEPPPPPPAGGGDEEDGGGDLRDQTANPAAAPARESRARP